MSEPTHLPPEWQERLDWMENRRGNNHDQDVLRKWIEEDFSFAGYPRSIHIAGTNGKGSVITWLELLLNIAGESSGSFISPHLVSHNERIRIDGHPVSMDSWQQSFSALEERFWQRKMTMFEMDLWMILQTFDKDTDRWILAETGMGGDRDATSALDYPYGIITRIGMDHMQYLGDTIEEIAAHKAGIFQPGMIAVTIRQPEPAQKVLEETALQKGTKLVTIDEGRDLDSFWNRALPVYQKENFLAALTLLEQAGFSFQENQLRTVCEQFVWPARFQILRAAPLLLLDGAHNPDGIDALVKSVLGAGYHFKTVYFSVLADKQADEMIEMLKKIRAEIVLVHFDSGRLADLQALGKKFDLQVIDFDQMIDRLVHTDQPALLCGSLYFAGEVLARSDTFLS